MLPGILSAAAAAVRGPGALSLAFILFFEKKKGKNAVWGSQLRVGKSVRFGGLLFLKPSFKHQQCWAGSQPPCPPPACGVHLGWTDPGGPFAVAGRGGRSLKDLHAPGAPQGSGRAEAGAA